MDDTHYSDVIIIGGGPAGTTAGTLLCRKGWQVTLFEKETHPRFHIGESLLPGNLPIFEELGVLEDIKRIGIFKPGADFSMPDEPDSHTTFQFDRALGDSPGYAYQVKRSEMDQLLFENCAANGVDCRQNHTVTKVALRSNGLHELHIADERGLEQRWSCKFLIDASGRDTMLASQEKWKERNPSHASAALFTHFDKVARRPGSESGNISIYWFEGGWIWMIPLSSGVTSVGVVARPAYLQQRKTDQDQFLLDTVKKSQGAWERLRDAKALMPVKATGNYSYFSARQLGQGYALVGDAYAFIDPVFSSGVYLAMSSGTDIVPVAEAWLNNDQRLYARECKKYTDKINRGIRTFSWFIYRFTTPAMMMLFRNPKNAFRLEQAVTSMLAGDVYGTPAIQLRLWLFKLVYSVSRLIYPDRSPDAA
ncbi:MAG: NAD(P)/FAD-dependent oxidoreductase [Gammaproteobacteria bacterium]